MSEIKYCCNAGAAISINQLSNLDNTSLSSIIRNLFYPVDTETSILDTLYTGSSDLSELLFTYLELNITTSYMENILQEPDVDDEIFNTIKRLIQLVFEHDDVITTPHCFRINFYDNQGDAPTAYSKCKLSLRQLLNLFLFIQDIADIDFKIFIGKVSKSSDMYLLLTRIITTLPVTNILILSSLNLDLSKLSILQSPIYSKCKYIYLSKNVPFIGLNLLNRLDLDGYMPSDYLDGIAVEDSIIGKIITPQSEYPIGFNMSNKQLYLQHSFEGGMVYELLPIQQLSSSRVIYPLINYLGYFLNLIKVEVSQKVFYISL